jgi:hypothetical protein
LEEWGFPAEAEQDFGRNSTAHRYEDVERQAKLRDDSLRALRDDIASHPEHYESKLAPNDSGDRFTSPSRFSPK